MEWYEIDRRRCQWTADDDGADANQNTDRRRTDRRQRVDRRQCIRLAYPLAAAPIVTNMHLQIVGISEKAIRFFISDFNPQRLALKGGNKIFMVLKFHDGEVVKRSGTILREDTYHDEKEYFVCLFDRHLPGQRIEKEKAHLLEKFPDFCEKVLSI